jgi:hypothetical protein
MATEDHTASPSEIDLNEFLRGENNWQPFVFDPQIESLPVERLRWDNFERLCAKLLMRREKGRLLQAFRYGRSGQSQFGIDILALKPGSKKQLLMQCKHVQQVKKGQLSTWIKKFLNEAKCKDADEFILCIASDIEQDRNLVEEWASLGQQLLEQGIAPSIWSLPQIIDYLRQEPEIVEEFFGKQFVPDFCSVAVIPEKYPIRFRQQYRNKSDNYAVFENETVRLDIFVPNERAPRVSTSLSLARADLSGITFTIPGEIMVSWLQWTAHAENFSNEPYAIKAHGFEDRYIFIAPDVRLMLDSAELTHLRWIFQNAWQDYFDAANELESKWRFLLFEPISIVREKTFGVAQVSRPLWRSILKYCQEHDFAHGSGAMNIFDGAPGAMKVYVPHDTTTLDCGYHLIMYAYQDAGNAGPYDDKLILGWTPLTSIGGSPQELHPRKAWDAAYSHEWIFNSLMPKIQEWINLDRTGRQNQFVSLFKQFSPKKPRTIDLSSHIYSLARSSSRDVLGTEADLQEIILKVHEMQSHFHVYQRKAIIESSLIVAVLKACARLAILITLVDDNYIRGNLQLGNRRLNIEIDELADAVPSKFCTPSWMDRSLCSLIAFLEGAESLPESELNRLSESLGPIWARIREDWICAALY